MREKEAKILEFISRINELYPDLRVNYSYNEETDQYSIWHFNQDLQFNNNDFRKNVGRLIKEVLYSENIFNFSFGYDHFKAKASSYNLTNLSSETKIIISTSDTLNYDCSFNQIGGINLPFDAAASFFVLEVQSVQIQPYRMIDSDTGVPNYPYEQERLAA